jgi:glycosyltransferase involved in cell wall biosynthesis
MIHYSVLIPERDAADAIGRIVPQLCQVLGSLLLPYEIICIDDASVPPDAQRLKNLLDEYAPLRVLRFDEPRGTGAALTAGLAASSGRLVIAIDPREPASARHIPQLVARLSQHDLVVARHFRPLGEELWQSVSRVPRLIAAKPQLHASEDLFWAARREAVAGLALARGAFRILGKIVAQRGFRVCRLLLADGLPPRGTTYRAGLVDRLAGIWLDRRFEPHLASEMVRTDGAHPRMVPARYDAARPHYIPHPVFMPVEQQSDDTA